MLPPDPSRLARTPLVACGVLNTNRREDTLECLRSIRASTSPRLAVIVLDCQSTDGSVDAIRAAHPDVALIELDRNLGYAGTTTWGSVALPALARTGCSS